MALYSEETFTILTNTLPSFVDTCGVPFHTISLSSMPKSYLSSLLRSCFGRLQDQVKIPPSWKRLGHLCSIPKWLACRHTWNVLWKLRCLESDHWHATGMLLPHHVGNVLVWTGFWHSEWVFRIQVIKYEGSYRMLMSQWFEIQNTSKISKVSHIMSWWNSCTIAQLHWKLRHPVHSAIGLPS